MAHLVLTVVGDDRAGLVSALAETISAHGGNWEESRLAELAGAFAGIVLVSVPEEARAGLVDALHGLHGMLRVTAHDADDAAPAPAPDAVSFTVLGNDRPGIVREVTAVVAAHTLSIESFRSRTQEAPMAGGTLFEATVSVRLPAGTDAGALIAALEAVAGEIQVDLAVG